MKENWCECKGHRSRDFGKLTDFYSRYFIPTGWELQYATLAVPEPDRILYITGKCSQCGGFMRTGIGVASSYTHDDLLRDICHSMLHHRPYASRDIYGLYRGGVPEQLEWYWRQDQLTKAERVEQFVALFQQKDQLAARRWAKENMPASVPRETSTEFFNAVVRLVQTNGFWPNQSAFITCEPASWPPDVVLCHPRFSVRPVLDVGPNGELRIDCYLDGIFDRAGNNRLLIGIIKTACADRDTCLIMGSLTGALLYYGNAYRDANLDRYEPHKAAALPQPQKKENENGK